MWWEFNYQPCSVQTSGNWFYNTCAACENWFSQCTSCWVWFFSSQIVNSESMCIAYSLCGPKSILTAGALQNQFSQACILAGPEHWNKLRLPVVIYFVVPRLWGLISCVHGEKKKKTSQCARMRELISQYAYYNWWFSLGNTCALWNPFSVHCEIYSRRCYKRTTNLNLLFLISPVLFVDASFILAKFSWTEVPNIK